MGGILPLMLFSQQVGELISRRGVHHPADISNLTEEIEKLIIDELESLSFKPVDIPEAAYPKSTLKRLEYSMGVLEMLLYAFRQNNKGEWMIHTID